MTTADGNHPSDELLELDATARAAASGLRSHMAADLDVEAPLGLLPRQPAARRRGRLLAVAAALALLAASATVLDRGDQERVDVEVDGDTDDEPGRSTGTLTPLGPRDGKDSIELPLTAEPHTGLVDGQEVAVSGTGFQPGESVGLVQCAKEAGGDSPEVRAGVQACYINQYTNVTADDAGVATGTYEVRRLLTTPLSGTIDCAVEAGRCMVAMGALADYDRSGVHPITFDPNVEPIDLPTVTVNPADGLSDGTVVQVVAEGLTPNDYLHVQVCSADPEVCSEAGVPGSTESSATETTTEWGGPGGFEVRPTGLQVGADGRAEGDVTVWQFLPGNEPGTYVDCAVSRCSLRFSGQSAPPTVPLTFVAGEPPAAPTITMEPAGPVAVGDQVVVRGAGFRRGTMLTLTLCALRDEPVEQAYVGCAYMDGPEQRVADDGTFTADYEIRPIPDETQAMSCMSEEECRAAPAGPTVTCGADGVRCELRADAYSSGGGPSFVPAPVPVTFR